jgi:hypothetical protein
VSSPSPVLSPFAFVLSFASQDFAGLEHRGPAATKIVRLLAADAAFVSGSPLIVPHLRRGVRVPVLSLPTR